MFSTLSYTIAGSLSLAATITYVAYLVSGIRLSNHSGIKWTSFLLMIKNPKRILQHIDQQAAEHGPILMQYLGFANHVVICDPKIVHYILKDDDKFPKMVAPTAPSIKKFGGFTVMNTNGKTYAWHKKPVSDFLSHQSVESFYPKFRKQADILTNELEKYIGSDINIGTHMVNLTLDVLGDTVLGINMGAIDGKSNEVAKAIAIYTREITNPVHMAIPNFEKLSFVQSNKELKYSLEVLERYVNEIVAKKKSQAKSIENYDMFDLIIDRCNSENVDIRSMFGNITSLMIAGYETTATSLTWIVYFLAQDQQLQERLYQEVMQDDLTEVSTSFMRDPNSLLGRVVKESLRINPPVALIPTRTCNEDQPLPFNNPHTGQQYVIPKGSYVSFSIWSVHHDPKYWDNPDVFNPDRWIPSSSSSSFSINKSEREAFLPFSTGKRPCLGKEFALIEQRVVLSTLLKKFRILPNSTGNMPTTMKGGIFTTPEQVSVRLEHR
jgi:cytochrome P450